MKLSRRALLAGSVAALPLFSGKLTHAQQATVAKNEELTKIAINPVLKLESIKQPVIIESFELLRNGSTVMVRTRTKDGVEGITYPNSEWMLDCYPIFINRIAPFFIGKDAREMEVNLEEVLRQNITYKLQGLALWVCVAAAEFGMLEVLGKVSGKPIGELFGGVHRRDIAVYRASGQRGNKPEEEIEYLKGLIAETGASALKFRVGGRWTRNEDSLPGRSEALIPLVRETFGKDMTIYADSNSSYDAEHAIALGRLMEKYNYGFFEEPCHFDDLWETKQVTDALTVPIAFGEQEFSLNRFQWVIANHAADIVQPDVHYFGGYIRSTKVARMAHLMGMQCTPHISGGLGYMDALHYMSLIPNPASHLEFKGLSRIPFNCATSSLKCEKGMMKVPSGPGFGIEVDPAYVKAATVIKAI